MRSDGELQHFLEFGTWPEEREVPTSVQFPPFAARYRVAIAR